MVFQDRKILFSGIVGLGTLFSGAALVTHIVLGVSLLLALVTTATFLLLAIVFVWLNASPEHRMWLIKTAKVGLVSGILATIAYDLSKSVFLK